MSLWMRMPSQLRIFRSSEPCSCIEKLCAEFGFSIQSFNRVHPMSFLLLVLVSSMVFSAIAEPIQRGDHQSERNNCNSVRMIVGSPLSPHCNATAFHYL